MLDHDTDAYYKISRAFLDGQPSGGLTRDHILDNITLYWLTSTGASAARSYWENTQAAAHAAASRQGRPEIKLPVGFTTFPGEIFRAPRSWAEKSYPSLSYFHEADKGGHFAAWEEPELFATEVRAGRGLPWPLPGEAADAPVAHAVVDQGEQLAGGGDLGDVLGLLAAAGDDGVLDLAGPRLRRAAAGWPR